MANCRIRKKRQNLGRASTGGVAANGKLERDMPVGDAAPIRSQSGHEPKASPAADTAPGSAQAGKGRDSPAGRATGKPKQQPYPQNSPGAKAATKKTTILGDGVRGTLRYGGEKVHRKFHAAVSEAEQDNAALETAHGAERIGEAIVRKGIRKGVQKGTQLARDGLKKMGDAGKKKNQNISKKPAADLAEKRLETGVKQSVNLGRDTPLPQDGDKQRPDAGKPTGASRDSPTHRQAADPKSKLQFGAAEKSDTRNPQQGHTGHAAPERRLHFDSAGHTAPPKSFKATMGTPNAQLGAMVDLGPKQPGLLSRGIHKGVDAGKRGLQFGAMQADMKIRGKLEQESGDNSAFKAFGEAEQLAERPAKYVLKKGTKKATQPVRTAANKVRNAIRHKFLIRKAVFLAKHRNIAQARGIVMKSKALIKELVLKSKPIVAGLVVCLIIYFVCTMVVGPITAIVSQAGAEYLITTTYPVANEDITGSTVQWTELEVALQQRIDDIETEFSDYDEYRYDIDPMVHDPFELMAYLAAMHLEFTHPDVQAEIAEIFGEVNALQLVPETETRYDDDGDPYDWKILNIILKPKSFEEVVTPRLEAADAKDLYDVFMGSGGNQQAFGNPFTFNWTNSISCYYGNRKNPTGPGYEFHTGLDIAAPEGTPIRSVQDGTVAVSGWHNLYGNYMVIRNDMGITTLYAHCSALYGDVGDVVRKGQLIAAVGSTGNSTGNHLHLEIKLNGERVNPLFYIQAYDE